VDCGVRNGDSTILLSKGVPSRDVWAFDSFEGLPAPTVQDADGPVLPQGAYCGSAEVLEQGFKRYGNTERLHVVKGWFVDTLEPAAGQIGAIAILHVDADYYESVKLALEVFYSRLSAGGYAIVDDYFSFRGARLATEELRARNRVRSPIVWDHYWRR
jgi:hypothetical protein